MLLWSSLAPPPSSRRPRPCDSPSPRDVVQLHSVPLFLSGHAHAYERLVEKSAGGDMTCIVTGGGGGKFTEFEKSRAEPGSKKFVAWLHHFVMLEIGETEIRGKMIPVDPGDAFVPGWHEMGEEFLVPLR